MTPADPVEGGGLHRFANPLRFQRVADAIFPWVASATAILTPIALYAALFVAPADYQQGEAYRIMFVHVPAAWMAHVLAGLFLAAEEAARYGSIAPRETSRLILESFLNGAARSGEQTCVSLAHLQGAVLDSRAFVVTEVHRGRPRIPRSNLHVDAIEKLIEKRTSIIIAHRLSTIKHADRILVLDKGTIAEIGTHDELLKRESGKYRKLYDMQFRVGVGA